MQMCILVQYLEPYGEESQLKSTCRDVLYIMFLLPLFAD